jgi:hypothetical protein
MKSLIDFLCLADVLSYVSDPLKNANYINPHPFPLKVLS